MTTLIHRRVAAARQGENPFVIERVPSGWVVLGEPQVLPGYCLLLPDPVVPDLNSLDSNLRLQFLGDMARVGDAILRVTGAVRINYELLGNLEPALHAHIVPRFTHEPEALRTRPFWFYDWEQAPVFHPESGQELLRRLREELAR